MAESPSKIEPQKPTYWMNSIALLAAKVSNKTIDDGMGIISVKAAIISP